MPEVSAPAKEAAEEVEWVVVLAGAPSAAFMLLDALVAVLVVDAPLFLVD